ncbi:40S ribosomal protein-like protein S8 [Saccharata proteae CBS 121410]|uniref:40S ribosomal protein-like protein S8 n=1 Tax=Saccharata proteae CBS 121410 TaxID=1314787 RepID=A0A6A5YBB8_9PEZI|nr:40S ribosomal protein-like protein S8 [Saccharata proteae CBS 121410]
MSLVNLANVCSHLQNASKARLGLTSVPLTKLHLHLALGMQKQGFISTVTPGGPLPPKTFALQEAAYEDDSAPTDEQLAEQPWLAYPDHSKPSRDDSPDLVDIPTNRAAQRLWLGLKYWDNMPVISEMKMVSKPTKRIWLNHHTLAVITRGREAGYVKGLTRPGECLFLTTDRGVMESREAVGKKLGGMVLCRIV